MSQRLMRFGRVFIAVVVASCVHVVTPEIRESPVEAGLPVLFADAAPLTWDFGDATGRVTGERVTHVFGHAGRFVTQAFDGERLVRRITTIVEPRSVFHEIPPDAVAVVVARNADELALAVDLGERIVGAGTMQRWLDDLPLFAFVLEQGSGRASLIEAREGLGFFSLEVPDVHVSCVGVTDGPRGLDRFGAWLIEHGWEGGPAHFTRDDQRLEVFIDRGVLYASLGEAGAAKIIAAANPRGLESSAALSDAINDVPSGGWVAMTRATQVPSQWSIFTGAMALTKLEARFSGRFTAKSPLWSAPEAPPGRLLEHAPDGPIAAVSLSVPPQTLASLVFGNPGTARRDRLSRDLGSDVEQAFRSLTGVADAAAYFDAEQFFRSTVENEGRPTARGTVLAEAAVTDALFLGQFMEAVLVQNGFYPKRAQDKTLNVWRFLLTSWPAEVAVTSNTFFFKAGEPIKNRVGRDLVATWRHEFDDAFAPGHVSLLIDVGQLRRELMEPRAIEGLDPRRVVTAQAIAQTLLDRVTQLDAVVLDIAPDAKGASVQAVVRVREQEQSP